MHALEIEQRFRRAPKLIPSGPKDKDFLFKTAPFRLEVPASIWLKDYVRLRDQLTIGSCVGNSLSFACESIRNKFKPYDEDSDLSRELAYTLAKEESGLLGKGDTGAAIRGGLDALRKFGLCSERVVPYDLKDWDAMPAQSVMDLCFPHRITLYERLTVDKDNYRNTIDAVKQALTMGLRVVAGVYWPRGGFYINGPLATHASQWNWINPIMSTIVGGHAILVGGYDDAIYPAGLGSVLLGNSWGPTWGDEGWSAVPWIQFNNMAFELWAIHDFDGFADSATPVDPPLPPEQKAALLAQMASMGIWPAAPEEYPAAYEFLRRRSISDVTIADLVSVSVSDLSEYKAANTDRLAAWTAF